MKPIRKKKTGRTMPASTQAGDVDKVKAAVQNKALSSRDLEEDVTQSEEEEEVEEEGTALEEMEENVIYAVQVNAPGSFWKEVDTCLENMRSLYPGGLNEVILESLRNTIRRHKRG